MTQPDPDGPATAVAFFRGNVEVARAVVPGHLLEVALPRTVRLERQSAEEVHLIETSDPRLECCGRLALPWVSRTGPGVEFMDIPVPAPFDEDDVLVMWRARNALRADRRPSTSGDADWSSLRRALGQSVDWEALEAAVASAAGLLNNWPSRPVPAVRWLPLDRAGGRLLVSITERGRARRAERAATGAPALTARRATVKQDRTLHALSAVSGLLATRIGDVRRLDQDPEIRSRLQGLFRQVAHRSLPSRATADPPPSVWSVPIAGAYRACLRALLAVHDLGPGTERAPLSELWELYQAWTAHELRLALDAALGAGEHLDDGSCIGRWQDGGATVELHYQPVIRARGRGTRILGQRFVAVIGDLEPDLLLVRRAAGVTSALVLDAKKRSSEMSGEDLTAHASKYLWGIRRADRKQEVPAVLGAVMLTPLGGPASGFPQGLGEAYRAHPSGGLGSQLAPALLALVRGYSSKDDNDWHPDWH